MLYLFTLPGMCMCHILSVKYYESRNYDHTSYDYISTIHASYMSKYTYSCTAYIHQVRKCNMYFYSGTEYKSYIHTPIGYLPLAS